MQQDMNRYDKNKNRIREYIDELDGICKSKFKNNFQYRPSDDDPYSKYVDVEDFKNRAIGKDVPEKVHVDRHCELVNNKFAKEIDADGRYFTKVRSKQECDEVRGVWDPTTMNRKTKYDTGMCWVTPEDKVCSDQYDLSLLKPYNKFKNMSDKKVEQAAKCFEQSNCKWQQQTANTFDCVKKKTKNDGSQVQVDDGPTMNPPSQMPLGDGLEEFLNTWYNDKHGKKFGSRPPEVGELIGVGNRCPSREEKLPDVTDVQPDAKKSEAAEEYTNYRNLNPYKDPDAEIIKKALGGTYKLFDAFKKEWNVIDEYGYDGYIRQYKNASVKVAKNLYDKMDAVQFRSEKELGKKTASVPTPKSVKAKKPLPSLPQSLINMVMKRVAQTDSDKRGLLAWHSTGSGKCHAKDSPILMFDGNTKMVQDIVV